MADATSHRSGKKRGLAGKAKEKVKEFGLSLTAFQKWTALIMGAIGVASSIATVYDVFVRDQESAPRAAVATNNGCVINGGSDNACNQQASWSQNPFRVAAVTWSAGWFEEAALRSGPTAESFFAKRQPYESIQKGTLLKAGGAVFGEGILTADLSAADDAVAHVVDIAPAFFTVRPSADVAWVYYEHPAGGGPELDRVFSLYLDKRKLVDEGVGGVPWTTPAGKNTEQLQHAFTVSRSDPVRIKVYANTCNNWYYGWGLRVTYTVSGQKFTQHLGSADHPFRSVGSVSSPVASFVQLPGERDLLQETTATPRSCSAADPVESE